MPATNPPDVVPLTAEALPDDVATLQRMVLELLASLRQRDRDYEAVRHRLDLLLRRLYGPRSERCDPSQLPLFADASALPADAAVPDAPTPTPSPRRRCRPHGRRRLPANLPRETRHHVLPEAARRCAQCGQVRLDIGVDKSEQLEYRPASLLVIEHVVHKYVCPCWSQRAADGPAALPAPGQESNTVSPPDPEAAAAAAAVPVPPPSDPPAQPGDPAAERRPEGVPAPVSPPTSAEPVPVVLTAPRPTPPLAKGLPGAGLLAHVIVSKFVDHLPLHRLERIYQRQGLFLPRSTLSDWLAACARALQPLYEALIRAVLQSRALHTDDTPVKVQDPATHHLSTGRLWAYLGDAAHPYNAFDFTMTRKRDGPQHFLATYQGYLHADAFSGYDGLYLPDPRTATARIVEVACNAHARRKFYEARTSASLEAHQALAYYRQLYELERAAQRNAFTDAQRWQMRQDLAVPILNRFQHWLEGQRAEVLPKSPLGEAISYALNNWSALVRYTEAGFLTIDNNAAEREMKRIAIGRKNWLFFGSARGGHTAAVLLSVTASCQRLGVEPWAYLQDVLTRLPMQPAGSCDFLLPDRWQATRATASAPTPTAAPPDPASAPPTNSPP
jgi:transposase